MASARSSVRPEDTLRRPFGLPIETEIARFYFRQRIESSAPGARLGYYRYTIAALWVFAIAILAFWAATGRDFSLIGFRFEPNLGGLLAAGAAAVATALLLIQFFVAMVSRKSREEIMRELKKAEGLTHFMPASGREYRRFMWVGISAGVTEEIIFRGFLIWAFSQFMPFVAAGLLSLAFFVFMHRYQGKAGMIQVAFIGAVLTAVYMVGGSLYPVIFLPIAVDVINNALIWRIKRMEAADNAA